MSKSVWNVPVLLADVPDTGLHLELEAPADVRVGLAELAGVRSLPELTASFEVTRRGAGLRVLGHITARVGQTCVVTLEPVENAVEEDIDLLFLPGIAEPRAQGDTEDELPEPLVDDRVDLGVIATEFLVLGIDPYPRKPGAAFESPQTDTDAPHPFAALAALKNNQGGSHS